MAKKEPIDTDAALDVVVSGLHRFSNAQLYALNTAVVEEIKRKRAKECAAKRNEFEVDMKVKLTVDGKKLSKGTVGTIVHMGRTKATVKFADGKQYFVPMTMLEKA